MFNAQVGLTTLNQSWTSHAETAGNTSLGRVFPVNWTGRAVQINYFRTAVRSIKKFFYSRRCEVRIWEKLNLANRLCGKIFVTKQH